MNFVYLAIMTLAALTATPALSATTERDACASGCLDTIAAVVLAIRAAPRAPDPVKVVMTVRAVDGVKDPYGQILYYVNSEEDYRSQISVNLQIKSNVAHRLSEGSGLDAVRRAFLGKRIVVQGAPTRVRINFFCLNRQTDKYYFQTHINIDNANQVTFVDGGVDQTSSTNRP